MTAAANDHERYLATLQRLLEIPATDMKAALTQASDALAVVLASDKVDTFLLDASRDSLVAVGTSTQPLSALEKQLGLDVLPVSNGGRSVEVFTSGAMFRSGNVQDDERELRGVREGLKVRSIVAAPLDAGGRRRGALMVSSLKPDFFSELDGALVESAARWVGSVIERAELSEAIKRAAVEQIRYSTAEELMTVLAHDLRNYLQPVTWRMHALRQRAARDARADDVRDVDAARAALSRVTALVSDLLDNARLDSGLYALQLQDVDLGVLLDEAAAEMSTSDHAINVNRAQAVVVTGDPLRLRQCVDNIIANALSHSPPGAPVHIYMERENSESGALARIEIVDEGSGIPESVLPHLFEKFYSVRGERAEGLGLGLYIAKRIASAHGGDVTADHYIGKGARFTIRIPIRT
jgi:two-component system, OmpR family, sensor kinase